MHLVVDFLFKIEGHGRSMFQCVGGFKGIMTGEISQPFFCCWGFGKV